MNAIREWLRSTKEEKERVKSGGVEVHTSASGGRFVKASEVLKSKSAQEHLRTMSEVTASKNGQGKVNG